MPNMTLTSLAVAVASCAGKINGLCVFERGENLLQNGKLSQSSEIVLRFYLFTILFMQMKNGLF